MLAWNVTFAPSLIPLGNLTVYLSSKYPPWCVIVNLAAAPVVCSPIDAAVVVVLAAAAAVVVVLAAAAAVVVLMLAAAVVVLAVPASAAAPEVP